MSEVSVIGQDFLFLHTHGLWVTPRPPRIRPPRGLLFNYFMALCVTYRPFCEQWACVFGTSGDTSVEAGPVGWAQ